MPTTKEDRELLQEWQEQQGQSPMSGQVQAPAKLSRAQRRERDRQRDAAEKELGLYRGEDTCTLCGNVILGDDPPVQKESFAGTADASGKIRFRWTHLTCKIRQAKNAAASVAARNAEADRRSAEVAALRQRWPDVDSIRAELARLVDGR